MQQKMIRIFQLRNFVLPAILFFFITACQTREPESQKASAKAAPNLFFDLKGYMAQQVAALKVSKPRVNKQISINGKSETQISENINFEEELGVFINADINKPAWSDKYSRDSSFSGGQLQYVRYLAKDEKMKTQMLQVTFSGGTVSKIELKNQTSAAIVSAEEEMIYTPGKGYSILHKEIPVLGEAKNFLVEATFE